MSEPIQVTSHVARDFLQNSAYFNTVPKVVWEYVSNSVDNPRPNQPVDVDVKISKERIVISDNGCGMSREGLRNFFQMHGENIARKKGKSVRGRYGTGKCAAFGLADVLRVETSQDGVLNIVELGRGDIQRYKSGDSFPVRDIVVNAPTKQEDGTRIIISGLNTKNLEIPATIAYVERHLGRQLHNHSVVINNHVCEYQEPHYTHVKRFRPDPDIARTIGDIELVVKISPVPLEKERAGIDILSKGIWHYTTMGTVEGDMARRIFGEVDVPALEDEYDKAKIPPFDNTRNMTLNLQNPLVASLLGWVDQCLHEVARELERQEKERKASEEAKQLDKYARQLAKLLNQDFKSLQMELGRIRRVAKLRGQGTTDEHIPGNGDMPTDYQPGGAEHGNGNRGPEVGPGEEQREGPSLLPGEEKGSPGKVSERRTPQSTFRVDYRHEHEQSPRSHYEKESRTIVINLDHPQISRAFQEGGGIESKQFRQMTAEVAFVEYAIALGHEMSDQGKLDDIDDALLQIRNTVNRVSRLI